MGRDMREHFGLWKMFSNLTVVMVTQLYTLIKTHGTVHLEWINFIVCNPYLNIPDSKYYIPSLAITLYWNPKCNSG